MKRKRRNNGAILAIIVVGVIAIALISVLIGRSNPDPAPINQSTVNQTPALPSFLQEHNRRFLEEPLPDRSTWNASTCIQFLSKVNSRGLYREYNGTFNSFCDAQQVCDDKGCRYLGELRKATHMRNALELQTRQELIKASGYRMTENGIKPAVNETTPDKARPAHTQVFIYYNNSLGWTAIPGKLQTDWLPDDITDPATCDYVWDAHPILRVQEKDACLLKVALTARNATFCEHITNPDSRGTCQRII